MKNTEAQILVDSSQLSVVGVFEILKIYPKLLKSLKIIKNSMISIKPDLLILIDFLYECIIANPICFVSFDYV